MLDVIEHPSGQIYSVKTFRPLWIFPWNSSVWRQFPFQTCIATISYSNKAAAEAGHQELIALLRDLKIGEKMREPFEALEKYGQRKTGTGVHSYRIYPGHKVEGKVTVRVSPERKV